MRHLLHSSATPGRHEIATSSIIDVSSSSSSCSLPSSLVSSCGQVCAGMLGGDLEASGRLGMLSEAVMAFQISPHRWLRQATCTESILSNLMLALAGNHGCMGSQADNHLIRVLACNEQPAAAGPAQLAQALAWHQYGTEHAAPVMIDNVTPLRPKQWMPSSSHAAWDRMRQMQHASGVPISSVISC